MKLQREKNLSQIIGLDKDKILNNERSQLERIFAEKRKFNSANFI